MREKGFVPVLVIILITVIGLGGYLAYQRVNKSPSTPPPNQVGCTEEAKLCPDGTSVGRVGPNCDFAPCPSPKESTTSIDFKPVIQPSLNKGWNIFTGKSTTFPYQPIFSIEYPNNWEVEDYLLYPFGKTDSNQNPTINLRAGGHDWFHELQITNKKFPGGIARYSWGKLNDKNYFVGFASFEKTSYGQIIIEASYIPLDKNKQLKTNFDQILSTFKFLP